MGDSETPQTTYAVDADAGLLRVHMDGIYSLEEWFKLMARVQDLDGYEPGMNALYDAQVATFDFSAEEVRSLTAWVNQRVGNWGSDWRFAIVVSTDLMFGVSRMVASWFADAPFEARVFWTTAEAEEWISEGS